MHSEKKGGRLETGPKLFDLFPVGYRTATPCFLTEIPIKGYFKMNCIMENNINRFLNCDFYKVLVDQHASI